MNPASAYFYTTSGSFERILPDECKLSLTLTQNRPQQLVQQVLVLRPIGGKSFDPAKDAALHRGGAVHDTTQFKFPSLDPETERFLWRRKADLDVVMRMLDKSHDPDGASKAKPGGASATTQPANAAAGSSSGGKLKFKSDDKSKPFSQSMGAFMTGASAAQKAQIAMITQIFTLMDADKDGLLSVSDVKAYFRSIGRNATDMVARRWIRDRDMDQVLYICHPVRLISVRFIYIIYFHIYH